MKKSTKKRKHAYLESAKKSSPSLELVILDQKPIRKKIISSCKKTIKDLKQHDMVEEHCSHMKQLAPRIIQINSETDYVEASQKINQIFAS